MSDRLYLNLWFPNFPEKEMLPRAASLLRQFPFSQQRPGITSMSVRPISGTEPVIFQQTFEVGADIDRVLRLAADMVHSDYSYEFEMWWDMWVPEEEGGELDTMWRLQPQRVRMSVYGGDYEDQLYQEVGHVQFELGLDSLFLYEHVELDDEGEQRIRANVQKLVNLTHDIESKCGISGRVLWSESDEHENLAQKLVQRLQRVH